MINILVTGANGQLATSIKDLAFRHKNLNFIYTDYKELDICNKRALLSFFDQYSEINYCINCAAYTAVDKAEDEVELADEVNSRGAKNLAEVCYGQGATLIHISTDFVFDGAANIAYTELDNPNPIGVYGESKLRGEDQIINICKKFFIIRTSWLYSEHGKNFMKTMLELAKTKKELNIISDQIGTPTYALDLASVILKIVLIEHKEYGIYHFSDEGVATWYDFTKAIFEFSNLNIPVNPIKTKDYPTPAKRPIFSVLDKEKIKKSLNLQIPHWRDSLKVAISNLSIKK